MRIFINNYSRRKKASLQLSINAIVVLVMAMVLLGLGLSFIRHLINQGKEKFIGAIDMTEIDNPATASQPLVVDHNVKLKSGGTTFLKLSYYNTYPTTKSVTIKGTGDNGGVVCYGSNSSATFSLSSISRSVDAGNVVGFRVLLKDADSASLDRYTCSIKAVDGNDDLATASFFLTVEG